MRPTCPICGNAKSVPHCSKTKCGWRICNHCGNTPYTRTVVFALNGHYFVIGN